MHNLTGTSSDRNMGKEMQNQNRMITVKLKREQLDVQDVRLLESSNSPNAKV